MPNLFDQTPPRVAYPNIGTSAWVVVSRLTEQPVRLVPNLGMVNHASEFALPLPTGQVPYKISSVEFDVQSTDDLGRPIYDDGLGGTTDDSDIDGNALPPLMETVSEDRLITLRENPELFNLDEVISAVREDFLKAFPFYDWVKIILFDDRVDTISTYQDQQSVSGFASGSPHLFLGPIFASYNGQTNPRGHLLLVAPEIPGVEYYYQIRYGIAGANGKKGPIVDIEQASRMRTPSSPASAPTQINICRWFPMTNLPVYDYMVTDATGSAEVSYFWLRTGPNGEMETPPPIIPFIIIMGRTGE